MKNHSGNYLILKPAFAVLLLHLFLVQQVKAETWVANNPSLGVATEFVSGLYLFTDAQATNSPQRFYKIPSP